MKMNIREQVNPAGGMSLVNLPADDAGFWKLWECYRQTFFQKCLQLMGGDPDEAQDALSEAMLHAREKFSRFAPAIHHFKAWALRLTENLCIDGLRKRKNQVKWDVGIEMEQARQVLHGNGDGSTEDGEFDPAFASETLMSESAAERLEREEILEHMVGVVRGLPPRLKEPALLRLFMNMPYPEVALKLHLTEETVRQRVHQARVILDSELKQLMGELPFSFPFPALETQLVESHLWQEIKEETEKILRHREPEIK
jgi:RNA polymerase sigma-70 factor, ECF subfamily